MFSNKQRFRKFGGPSPTTDMNMPIQKRKTVTTSNQRGLDFTAKPNPWDVEFADAPAAAFRLWALKYFGRHFHEESFRSLERSFERSSASLR